MIPTTKTQMELKGEEDDLNHNGATFLYGEYKFTFHIKAYNLRKKKRKKSKGIFGKQKIAKLILICICILKIPAPWMLKIKIRQSLVLEGKVLHLWCYLCQLRIEQASQNPVRNLHEELPEA